MENKFDPENLLAKYRNGTCTPEERLLLESWHLNELRSKKNEQPDVKEMHAAHIRMWQNINSGHASVRRLSNQWFYYAASVLVFFGLGIWLLNNSKPIKVNHAVAKVKPIQPGGNRAVLTLANGKQVVLDGAATGLIANDGKIAILKNADGLIEYQNTANNVKTAYNTLTIPRGGTYSLILGDGTKVWLNSATTMRYPTSFAGKTREVEVSGEAYFEVAKNKEKPFIVSTPEEKIRVLGTHFNVHAYTDEDHSETTLLEGKVQVSKGKQLATLNPGQQATNIKGNTMVKVINIPDAEDAIAWKNGLLTSSNESIYSVMNKIARWYDVDIEYRGDVKGKAFGGIISKFKSVNEVLSIIELTGSIHFKIEGRRIIVMP